MMNILGDLVVPKTVLQDYSARLGYDIVSGPPWMSRTGDRNWLRKILHRASVDDSIMEKIVVYQDALSSGIRLKFDIFVTDELLMRLEEMDAPCPPPASLKSASLEGLWKQKYIDAYTKAIVSEEEVYRRIEMGELPVSAAWVCSRCGGKANHVNLRGNKECDGCGYPL